MSTTETSSKDTDKFMNHCMDLIQGTSQFVLNKDAEKLHLLMIETCSLLEVMEPEGKQAMNLLVEARQVLDKNPVAGRNKVLELCISARSILIKGLKDRNVIIPSRSTIPARKTL